MTTVTLPIKVVNILNVRDHWATRAKRAKAHRGAAKLALFGRVAEHRAWLAADGRVVVTLTRLSPRYLDEHDGLRASLKAVVDGIADALGLASDRDARIAWLYRQERGKPKQSEVLVELRDVPTITAGDPSEASP